MNSGSRTEPGNMRPARPGELAACGAGCCWSGLAPEHPDGGAAPCPSCGGALLIPCPQCECVLNCACDPEAETEYEKVRITRTVFYNPYLRSSAEMQITELGWGLYIEMFGGEHGIWITYSGRQDLTMQCGVMISIVDDSAVGYTREFKCGRHDNGEEEFGKWAASLAACHVHWGQTMRFMSEEDEARLAARITQFANA